VFQVREKLAGVRYYIRRRTAPLYGVAVRYARQFLGRMEKPDVDYIEGLSPAISIDQKGVGKNPRSTMGTITEIYDYLRLLLRGSGILTVPNAVGKSPVRRWNRLSMRLKGCRKAGVS